MIYLSRIKYDYDKTRKLPSRHNKTATTKTEKLELGVVYFKIITTHFFAHNSTLRFQRESIGANERYQMYTKAELAQCRRFCKRKVITYQVGIIYSLLDIEIFWQLIVNYMNHNILRKLHQSKQLRKEILYSKNFKVFKNKQWRETFCYSSQLL